MRFEDFIKLYNEIYKAGNRIYHAFALKCGLSDSALAITYELRMEGQDGISQRDLGATLSLSKQTVNSSIKSLADMGLVELKEGKADKREKAVILTDKGEKFCIEKIDRIIHAEERAFSRLTEEEARALMSAEKKYYSYFLEESKKAMDN
ncbi:MAG: winged helix DNA-binding protein [Clostridia bacterium]|nr:winged helix DNA-binding protein [Clostridia bacterium]MDE7348318.1 winged helix DNA-binding protein [Clostridia bacterium]